MGQTQDRGTLGQGRDQVLELLLEPLSHNLAVEGLFRLKREGFADLGSSPTAHHQ